MARLPSTRCDEHLVRLSCVIGQCGCAVAFLLECLEPLGALLAAEADSFTLLLFWRSCYAVLVW